MIIDRAKRLLGKARCAGRAVPGHSGLAGVFMTIDVSGVEPVGPTPKGITWSGLNITGAADRWVCRVLIDV